MRRFEYKAKEGPTKIIEGIIESESLDLAVQEIIRLGFTPIDITIPKSVSDNAFQSKHKFASLRPYFGNNIRFNDVVLFTRQISDLVDASIPIFRALKIISEQTRHKKFKEAILSMYCVVRDGGAFSEALAKNRDIFSLLYVGMVATGEGSGKLSVALERLSAYLEQEQENRGKIKASLAYPSLILIVGFITIFVLLTFVIPRLSLMFDDINQSLPDLTLLLVGISELFRKVWWLMLSLVGFGIIIFRKWVHSEKGRLSFDSFVLKLPLFSEFIKIVEVERFSRTLATQIETGVSITEAFDSVLAIVCNLQLRNELKNVALAVANGESLKTSLGRTEFFPKMAVNMISIGEETGRLEKGFYKVADIYGRQVDRLTKTIISLLGPILLIFIVTIVGFVVIAMLLPIFQMNLLVG